MSSTQKKLPLSGCLKNAECRMQNAELKKLFDRKVKKLLFYSRLPIGKHIAPVMTGISHLFAQIYRSRREYRITEDDIFLSSKLIQKTVDKTIGLWYYISVITTH